MKYGAEGYLQRRICFVYLCNLWMDLPAWFALEAIVITITAATAAVTATTTTAATSTTKTATATAATAAAVCSWLGLIDGQIASAKVLAIKSLDSCCCLLRGCHLHKSKAA